MPRQFEIFQHFVSERYFRYAFSANSFFFFTTAFNSSIFYNLIFKMNIYVSNLGFNVEDEDLKGFFADYGTVTSAKVITDKLTQRSRGFGFVEMSDDAAGQKAIDELNGAVVEGRSISVTVARPKEDRSNSKPAYNKSRW